MKCENQLKTNNNNNNSNVRIFFFQIQQSINFRLGLELILQLTSTIDRIENSSSQ